MLSFRAIIRQPHTLLPPLDNVRAPLPAGHSYSWGLLATEWDAGFLAGAEFRAGQAAIAAEMGGPPGVKPARTTRKRPNTPAPKGVQ